MSEVVAARLARQSPGAEDAERRHERDRDDHGDEHDAHAGDPDRAHDLRLEDEQPARRDRDGEAREDDGAPGRRDGRSAAARHLLGARHPVLGGAMLSSSRNRLTVSSP